MTTADCKQLVEAYLHALSGQAKTPALVDQFVTDERLKAHIRDVEAAFPAYEIVTEELIGERDLVAVRGQFRGTHRAVFAGIPATGRTVSAPLMIFYRLENDRIVDHWLQFDGASLVAQLQQPALT